MNGSTACKRMAFKDFHTAPGLIETDEDRRRKRSLIGGDLALRRQHGKPVQLNGRWILDPIFRDDDLQSLQQFCQPQANSELAVEVGFQLGEFAVEYCVERPASRFVGFEVRKHFCEETDALMQTRGIESARFCLADARTILPEILEPGTLDHLYVFFPDPWWKPRHVRKRLVSGDFLADAAVWLRPGGRFLLKTDVQAYAQWALALLTSNPMFTTKILDDRHADLPWTLRERRSDLHGHPTWAIEAVRNEIVTRRQDFLVD